MNGQAIGRIGNHGRISAMGSHPPDDAIKASIPGVESKPSYGTDRRGIFDKKGLNYRLLGARDVADILGIGLSTVYLAAKVKRIPCIMLGRMVRFRPEDIQAILDGKREL